MRVKRILLFLCAILLAIGLFTYVRFAGSLPALEGEIALEGLEASVVVERDAIGVPRLRGQSRLDLSRALGFVHAQERFFQMDLMRRSAAGELAALIGPAALPLDRARRFHRMRFRAERVVAAMSEEERDRVEAYVEGVNAGLVALEAPPFEYLLLRQEPSAWALEDSVLVILAMFFQLNDDTGRREAAKGLLYATLPLELAAFLTPAGTPWDAPVDGDAFDVPPVPEDAMPIGPIVTARREVEPRLEAEVGSNNWAVSTRRSTHGGALLASDMHLGHAVPNIWFRAVLEWEDRRLAGVTLPGTPFLVAGSNGHIAWGFTNSNGDWTDLVRIEADPDDPERYRTPVGWMAIETHRETLEVRGGEAEVMDVRETIWGPIVDRDFEGRELAARWIAHDVAAVNLDLAQLEFVETVEEALPVAAASGIPPQNVVVVDRAGTIAWTIAGAIPNRVGFDGALPSSWADGMRRWDGYIPAGEYPRIIDPAEGFLWTANARVVAGEALALIGDGGYAFGARAAQIRDGLAAIDRASEKDMLDVQLDDRALFLERWRSLFLELLSGEDALAEVRRHIDKGWTGRASTDSVGYRTVRDLRDAVDRAVLDAMTHEARKADERFRVFALRQREGPLWKLVSEQPLHLVPEPYRSWNEALLAIVTAEVATWEEPLAERSWGKANTSAIRHPLSRAVPALARFTDLPPHELPGDRDMPRVQAPSSGASERFVVSPGREEEGLFHMPGGQSGHPLSPYYGAGHEAWETGEPTPFLPGPIVWTLTLSP